MKIILLLRILWTGGAQRIAIEEAKALKDLGHEVEVVFLRGSSFSGYEEILRGVNYSVLSPNGNSIFSPLYDFITRKFRPDRGSESRVDYNLIRDFPNYAHASNVDMIVCHDQYAGLAGYYSKRKFGIPYRVFLHEKVESYSVPILGNVAQRIEFRTLNEAEKVLSVTKKVAESSKQLYSIDSTIDFPGIKKRTSLDFGSKENDIVAVSMWDKGRKPQIYLELLEKLPEFGLQLVGNWRDKGLREAMKSLADKKKMAKRVTIRENIQEDFLRMILARSKFSIRFGFGEYGPGMSVIESIENGTPVIVNGDLGSSDLVSQLNLGFVSKKTDLGEIADFVQGNNERSRYQKLIFNLEKAYEFQTWKNHATKLLS